MKTFILKHKKLLMACLFCTLVVTLLCATFLTGSAFTMSTTYTVSHRSAVLTTQSVTGTSYSSISEDGYSIYSNKSQTFISVNGKVYENASAASSLTFENSVLVSTLGEADESSDEWASLVIYDVTNHKRYEVFGNNAVWSGNSCTVTPFLIESPGTYYVYAVFQGSDSEVDPERSARMTIVIEGISLETPTKTGYNFTGWYTDEACTNKYTGTTITSNMTLYAGWEPITYYIVFNANGGSGSMTKITCQYDTEYTLTANTFSRTYYLFKGWSTTSGGTVKYNNSAKVSNLTTTHGETVTLYAVWNINSYTVTFNANGGSGTMSSQNINHNKTVALSANKFTREGYYFVGWSTSASGNVVYADMAEVLNAAGTGTSVTLYAIWHKIPCTVTFVVDGQIWKSIVVDYGTLSSDVIASNVSTALYDVVDEDLLPN